MYHLLRKNILSLTLCFYLIAAVMIVMLKSNLPFAIGYGLLLLAFFLASMFNNALGIPMQTIFMKEFDKEMMARAMTGIQMISMAIFPLAAVIGGLLIEWLGMTYFLIIASSMLVIPTLFIYMDKKISTI